MPEKLNRRSFMGAAAAVAAGGLVAGAAEEAAAIKIIGIGGSLRKGKTTVQALQIALDAAKAVNPAIETEIIELSGMNLDPYLAIGAKTVDKPDDFPALKARLIDPRVKAVIFASPVYMGIISSPLKALFERMIDFRQNGYPLMNKVGGAIAVGAGRNTGQELILQQLCMFMISQNMLVVGDGPPTSHWGGAMRAVKDDVSTDTDGLPTTKGLGKRVAEVALKLAGMTR
ncbi:MAG: flavodoxin family protein [Tepidisphaeraceae bacterium]|jgi:multimeric flavodoxin WrbA